VTDGTAVPPMSLDRAFSAILGGAFPRYLPRIPHLDFGPGSTEGIPANLPGVNDGEDYTMLVSAVDADRNEVAGLRLPDLTIPLATYTGWNLRHPETGAEDQIAGLWGATFPFPRDAKERKAAGDPRPSIAERYSSREEYLLRFREAAMMMVQARHILAEDVERMVEGERSVTTCSREEHDVLPCVLRLMPSIMCAKEASQLKRPVRVLGSAAHYSGLDRWSERSSEPQPENPAENERHSLAYYPVWLPESVDNKKEPSRIVLRISDNGKGIKEDQLTDPKSFGLIGMRERALSHGGTVKITSIPDKGTMVVVSIPVGS